MVDALEPLPLPEELYDYRGAVGDGDDDPPPLWLPYHQGDVFAEVDIPGIDSDDRLAMLFLHPCTMRKGAVLKDRVTVVAVSCESAKKVLADADRWSKRFAVMPLPDLFATGKGTYVADFLKLGTVASGGLHRSRRLASLSQRGRAVFQQRIINHLTRLTPSVDEIETATRAVEIELTAQSDWVEAACLAATSSSDGVVEIAEKDFDEWMSLGNRRDRLMTEEAAAVVSETYREQIQRYGG